MLRHWSHPQTHQVRLYVNTSVIQDALEKCDFSYAADKVKAYYIMGSNPQSPAELKTYIATEESVPKSHVRELQRAIVEAVSGSERESWNDLESRSRRSTNQNRGTGESKAQEQPGSAPAKEMPASLAQQARNIDLTQIELPSPVDLELSIRETALIDGLLNQHARVSTTRKERAMADIRLISQSGVELLVNRYRVDAEERSLKEGLDKKDLFLDVEKVVFRAQSSNHPVIPVILLEGNIEQTNLKLAQLNGLEAFLIGAQRLSVLQTVSAEHSVQVILKITRQVLAYETEIRRHHTKPTTLIDQQSYLLQSLPGVSEIMAEAMLRHFGSIQEVLKASEAELSKVKGIGDKKAREIAIVLGTQLFT